MRSLIAGWFSKAGFDFVENVKPGMCFEERYVIDGFIRLLELI